nr:hypothetical protein [Tanacetum cinerariifolium]
MFIEIIRDDDEPQNENPNVGGEETTEKPVAEYIDTFPTKDELAYHRMILEGRFSQLSYVSSPSLSKPEEY